MVYWYKDERNHLYEFEMECQLEQLERLRS